MNPNDLTRTLLDIARTPLDQQDLEDISDTFSDDERFTEREPEVDEQTGWVSE